MKNKNLFKLGKKLIKLREEAERFGIFTGDRELLKCPKCGLLEDVDINGRLFTVFNDSHHEDTGLKFQEVEGKENSFRCPNCGKIITLRKSSF